MTHTRRAVARRASVYLAVPRSLHGTAAAEMAWHHIRHLPPDMHSALGWQSRAAWLTSRDVLLRSITTLYCLTEGDGLIGAGVARECAFTRASNPAASVRALRAIIDGAINGGSVVSLSQIRKEACGQPHQMAAKKEPAGVSTAPAPISSDEKYAPLKYATPRARSSP